MATKAERKAYQRSGDNLIISLLWR